MTNNIKKLLTWIADNNATISREWETEKDVAIKHYLIDYNNSLYHISFMRDSIICSRIINLKKGRKKDIYRGRSMSALLELL